MKVGNYSIEQIFSVDHEEHRLGIVRKGWQLAQGLCKSYPDEKVAIIASEESFSEGTLLQDIYNIYKEELKDCMIEWEYPIFLEFVDSEDNPAMELIDKKANGYMNYSKKMQ